MGVLWLIWKPRAGCYDEYPAKGEKKTEAHQSDLTQ